MNHEFYMQRCLQLAKQGLGKIASKPGELFALVGSVLVFNNKIIGEGFYKKFGESHAEVNCLNSVKKTDLHLVKNATLYVNLEPCSHIGKTPPCVNLILEKEIKKVVIASKDTAKHVNGTGIEKLRKAGVEVTIGILDKENQWLNRRFFTYFEKQRPYIILKWAQTKNGFIAPKDENQKWISNDFSKKIVHKWRSEEQAILVGNKTFLIDKPQLNNRLWTGISPLRIIIDKDLKIDLGNFTNELNSKTLIFNELEDKTENNFSFIKIDFAQSVLQQILNHLYKENINSVIVEGGLITLQHFIKNNLWDEARIIEGNTEWKNGEIAPKLSNFSIVEKKDLQGDCLTIFKNDFSNG